MVPLARSGGARATALVAAGIVAAACTRWSDPRPLEPARFLGTVPYGTTTVKVIPASGAEVTVMNPFVAGDSLLWLEAGPAGASASTRRAGLRLAQVRAVEVRESDPVSTALVVAAVVGLAAGLVVAELNAVKIPLR